MLYMRGTLRWLARPRCKQTAAVLHTCRLRWVNQLRDDIKTESFSEEEDRILLEAHNMYGNRWTQIAKMLPGR
jgi:hypothetical protein